MAVPTNSSATATAPPSSLLRVLRDSTGSTGLVAPQFIICALLLTTVIFLFPNVISIVTVSTGMFGRWSDPKLWPPMFNSMSEAYSLQRYWGKYWHMMLRRTTDAPGFFLQQEIPVLRNPKNQVVRLVRRYGLLFLSFAVSGLIHAAGSYMVTRDFPEGWSDGGAMVYFLVQPAFILVEDTLFMALGVPDDGNPALLRRLFGYAYVTAWWLWCFPTLKVAPLAAAHRLDGWDQDSWRASVVACKELADAYPFNPARNLWQALGRS
ncbi:hypothetical protein S40293_10271 [Stachybotrys chartarum IBT 40293]|nr:hypothetical protein S40293_10271 [Stachybotrys chartarum IBT 40293]